MTIADTFDRGDSTTTINPASDGGTWVLDTNVVTPVYGISSNQAILVSGANTGCRARRNTNQTDTDMTITVNFTGFSRTHLWFTYDPVSDTGYYFQPWGTAGFYKWVTGTPTQVGAAYSNPAAGIPIRLTYVHATGVLQAFYSAVSQGTRTDGAPITAGANSWVGFDSSQANSSTGESWNDFSAVSSAPPGPKAQSVFTRRFATQSRASVI